MTRGEPRTRRRGDAGDRDVEQRIRIGAQVQARVDELPAIVLEIDGLVALQQPHDDAEAVFQIAPRVRLLDADHRPVGRQRARSDAEHHAPAREMVEQDDALGDPERVVIGEADDAGAELDMARPFGRHRHEDFGRGADLRSRRMMLAAPGFVIAAAVEPLDQLEIALQRERRIDAWLVERRQKDPKTKTIRHAVFLPSRDRVEVDRSRGNSDRPHERWQAQPPRATSPPRSPRPIS